MQQQPPSIHPVPTQRSIQVPLQRRKRHLSFWQRTMIVFMITALLGLVVGTMLYTRTFSMDTEQTRESDAASPIIQLLQNSNGASTSDAQSLDLRSSLFQEIGPQQNAVDAAVVGLVENEVALAQSRAVTSTVLLDDQPDDRPELQRAYRLAEQAIEFDDPRQAMESLLVLSQNHPAYRAADVTALLFRAYLAVGDLAMRDGEQRNAIDFYERANQLAVADKTALARRQQAIKRFLSAPIAAAIPTVAVADESPAVAAVSVATPTAIPTVAPVTPLVRVPVQCPDDHITISAPAVNEILSGYAAVMGSVALDDLWFYKVEWASASSTEFSYFAGQGAAVRNGALGTLDTRILANGAYVLRVTVVDDTGNYPTPCDIPVTIQN